MAEKSEKASEKRGQERAPGGKPRGWFSRRHETCEARDAAVARYRAQHGRRARQQGAYARLVEIKRSGPLNKVQAVEHAALQVALGLVTPTVVSADAAPAEPAAKAEAT